MERIKKEATVNSDCEKGDHCMHEFSREQYSKEILHALSKCCFCSHISVAAIRQAGHGKFHVVRS